MAEAICELTDAWEPAEGGCVYQPLGEPACFACARAGWGLVWCVCVCVSNPVSKGLISSRGTELSDATLSNEARHQRGKHPLAMDVYLLLTVEQAVQLTLFAFMVLHDTPPKPSHRVLATEPHVFVSASF